MRPSRRRPNSAAKRLLHLEHEVAAPPDVVHRRDARADGLVGGVGEGAAFTRALFDEDVMALLRQLPSARGRESDAVLVRLDFLGDADPHGLRRLSHPTWPEATRPAA